MATFQISNVYLRQLMARSFAWLVGLAAAAALLPSSFITAVCLLGGLFFGFRIFLAFKSKDARVELNSLGVSLPAVITGTLGRYVPFADFEIFARQSHKGRERILLTTKARGFSLPSAAFDSEALKDLELQVIEHQKRSDEGKKWLARRELDRLHIRAFRHLPAHLTRVIMVLILLGYAAEVKWGALDLFTVIGGDPIRLLSIGAYSSVLVGEEHLYRFVVTMFLHAGLLHLYVNGMAFWALGGLLERLIGSSRFLLIYFVSGVVGTFVSGVFRDAAPAVGASGGIFGLLGAFFVLHHIKLSPLPRGLRQTHRWWLVILVINLGLPLLMPQVDGTAHMVGMVTGAALTFGLLFGKQALAKPNFALRVYAVLVAAGVLAMLSVGARQIRQNDPEAIADTLLDNVDRVPSVLVNQISWGRVEAFNVTSSALEKSVKACRASLNVSPDDYHLRDTLAALHFRLGDSDAAVNEEFRAFQDARTDFLIRRDDVGDALISMRIFASQFYRYIGVTPNARWHRLDYDKTGVVDHSALTEFSGTSGFYAVRQNDDVVGVLWLKLPRSQLDSDVQKTLIMKNLVDYRTPPAEVTPLFQRPLNDGEGEYAYFPLESDVLSLPPSTKQN